MKVLTKKLLTALRVKMNTYYGELEKERRLTDSLEECSSYTGQVAHSFCSLTKGNGAGGEESRGRGPDRCQEHLIEHVWCMQKPPACRRGYSRG